MILFKHKKLMSGIAPVALAVFVGLASPSAEANISREMDKIFNSMTNTTQPGAFKSQRRGAMVGGRLTSKARIIDPKIVTFVPPSFAAGCGGIDLFGGSLSFVNKDQLVQVFRAVAANAAGYAFQLALDNLFPDGAKWIEAMQKKIQQLNDLLSNSCEMAQGLVDATIGGSIEDGAKAAGKSIALVDNSVAEGINALWGVEEDNAAAKMSGSKSPREKRIEISDEEKKKVVGNVLWNQFKQNNVQAWFTYGNNELLEQIMSITGTVVVHDPTQDPNSGASSVNTFPVTELQGGLIGLMDLVDGTDNGNKYSCSGDTTGCFAGGPNGGSVSIPSIRNNITIPSFRQKIEDTILGTNGSGGVVAKYRFNQGQFTVEEESLMVILPTGMGRFIRDLSVMDDGLARDFVHQTSRVIALDIMYSVSKQIIQGAKTAMMNSQNINKGQVVSMLNRAESNLHTDYQAAVQQSGSIDQVIMKYNGLMKNVRANQYYYLNSTQTK